MSLAEERALMLIGFFVAISFVVTVLIPFGLSVLESILGLDRPQGASRD